MPKKEKEGRAKYRDRIIPDASGYSRFRASDFGGVDKTYLGGSTPNGDARLELISKTVSSEEGQRYVLNELTSNGSKITSFLRSRKQAGKNNSIVAVHYQIELFPPNLFFYRMLQFYILRQFHLQ